jgi:DNA-binding MarR family transcriptional regulator
VSKLDGQNRSQIVESTLDLLDTVASDDTLSQRGIAERIGMALGLTNAVLKRCVKKGLLKIKQAPARRYAYYLTPQGFSEKSRLTAEFLSTSLTFYRRARQEYSDIIRYCETREWNRVVFIGASDLAEIASLVAIESNVTVVGVVDPKKNAPFYNGLPVFRSLADIPAADQPAAAVLSDIDDPQGSFEELMTVLPAARVLTPRLLRISRPKNQEEAP